MVKKSWFAVYTKPRTEKKVDLLLQKKQIESWCPLQKVEKQWSDRKKIVHEPLFKSYVFVYIDETERVSVLRTDGVLNYVHFLGKPAIIKDEDINLVKSFLQEADTQISTQSWESLEENIKVEIKQGVFMHNTGTVVKSGKKKVYVRLESLGQVMIVEFPLAHVKAINE